MSVKLYSLILVALALCLSAVTGCASEGPIPRPAPRTTPSQPVNPASPEQTATLQPTPAPTSSSPVVLYDDKAAPFTVQYPRDWKIREEPESIFFVPADDTATFQVITYEYQEGAPRNITAKDILNNFVQNFSQGKGIKLTQQVTNPDSSVNANVEFTDGSARPQQGIVHVALAKSRRYHFILLFAANRDQFARYKAIAASVVESFRER